MDLPRRECVLCKCGIETEVLREAYTYIYCTHEESLDEGSADVLRRLGVFYLGDNHFRKSFARRGYSLMQCGQDGFNLWIRYGWILCIYS